MNEVWISLALKLIEIGYSFVKVALAPKSTPAEILAAKTAMVAAAKLAVSEWEALDSADDGA